MVKATINNFESLALSGKTLGNLTYSTRKSVGKRSDTDTAAVNINGTLDTLNIEPQAGFDFGMERKTPLKLVNGKLVATEARSSGRSNIVYGIQGSLLPLSDPTTDEFSEDDYDMVFVTGKDDKPVGRVRSKDAFDSHDLELFDTEAILKRDYRGQLQRDEDTGETIITGYSLDFIQTKKGDDEIGHLIRIILPKNEFDRLRPNLKAYGKYVPQGLKLAFVGNETTNWTIYADTLVPFEEKKNEKTTQNQSKATTTQADKAKG